MEKIFVVENNDLKEVNWELENNLATVKMITAGNVSASGAGGQSSEGSWRYYGDVYVVLSYADTLFNKENPFSKRTKKGN